MQLLSYNITNLEMFSLFTSIFFYRFFILLSACFRVILRFPSIYLSCLIIANYPYCLSVNYFYLFFVYSTCPRCSSRQFSPFLLTPIYYYSYRLPIIFIYLLILFHDNYLFTIYLPICQNSILQHTCLLLLRDYMSGF